VAAVTESLKRNAARTLSWRAARSLAFAFALSFVNLAGAFLALSLLGGIRPWTDAQFVGLFGLVEAALGLGYLFAPNAWRLPVAEANTPDRTAVRLAASTQLVPHWAALAKVAGGLAMLAYAAAREGVSPATLGVIPEIALIAIAFLAVTVAVARIGVARPGLDVFFVTVRRPGHEPRDLPGLTASGLVVQLLSTMAIFPLVEVLEPGALFQPELAPSAAMLGVTLAAALTASAVAVAAWWGRMSWAAPDAQQQEAERELAPSG
jgi:hypothetical protein